METVAVLGTSSGCSGLTTRLKILEWECLSAISHCFTEE